MSKFELAANERATGKKSVMTGIREASRVPAVVYGFDTEVVPVEMDYNQTIKVIKGAGTSHTIDLKIKDKTLTVIIRDYQQNPVTDKVTHVDFLAVSEKKPITTFVPIEFVGVSKAVKQLGCKLNIKNDKLKVRALAKHLPERFVVDLAELDTVGKIITIGDIKVGPEVTIMNNPKDPVASVTVPKVVVEVAATAAAPTEGAPAAEGAPATEGENKEAAPEAKK